MSARNWGGSEGTQGHVSQEWLAQYSPPATGLGVPRPAQGHLVTMRLELQALSPACRVHPHGPQSALTHIRSMLSPPSLLLPIWQVVGISLDLNQVWQGISSSSRKEELRLDSGGVRF